MPTTYTIHVTHTLFSSLRVVHCKCNWVRFLYVFNGYFPTAYTVDITQTYTRAHTCQHADRHPNTHTHTCTPGSGTCTAIELYTFNQLRLKLRTFCPSNVKRLINLHRRMCAYACVCVHMCAHVCACVRHQPAQLHSCMCAHVCAYVCACRCQIL